MRRKHECLTPCRGGFLRGLHLLHHVTWRSCCRKGDYKWEYTKHAQISPPNPSEGEIRLCVVSFLAVFSPSIENFHEPMGRPFIRSSYRTKHRMVLKGCFQVQVLLRRAKGSVRTNLTGRTTHGIPLTSASQHARQSVSFAANSQRRRSESGPVKLHKGFWRRLSDRKACRRQVGMSAD